MNRYLSKTFHIFSLCCCLIIKLCLTLRDPLDQSMPGPPGQSLVKVMLVASMTLSNHLILCRPLLLLPSHFPSIRVFSRESSLLMRRVYGPLSVLHPLQICQTPQEAIRPLLRMAALKSQNELNVKENSQTHLTCY